MFVQGSPFEPDPADWYVVQLRPGQLERARLNLERQGYRSFMPLVAGTARRGRRVINLPVPLFPGYLFVSIAPEQPWHPVNATFGVLRLVMRDGRLPQPVPQATMRALLAQTGADGLFCPVPDLAPGDTVRILTGPMAEMVAQVDRLSGTQRACVLLEMMGQATRMDLDRRHLARLSA